MATPPASRLFPKSQLRLRATGQARLKRLARRPDPLLTASEERQAEDRATMQKLTEQGLALGERFKLRWTALEAERDGVVEHYGICYEDGVIRIRLRHATTGRLLKESSLVDTLCHEMAHLRYLDHSIRFRRLYQRILQAARELGYYQPGPQKDDRPLQLTLFGAGCGTRGR